MKNPHIKPTSDAIGVEEFRNAPILQDWLYVLENGSLCLAGYIYSDPRANPLTGEFTDGHRVITSALKKVVLEDHLKLGQTRNSTYLLGRRNESAMFVSLTNIAKFDKVLPKK